MSYECNERDIELLNKNPHQLLLQYQKLIDNVIYMFMKSGSFKTIEHKEVKQQINEELLNRLPKIRLQYQGKSQLKTYISVVIRNICNEIVRKKVKNQVYLEDNLNIANDTHSHNSIDILILEEEMLRLRNAVGMYHKQKQKLILCLKLRFRMPFNMADFQNVFGNFNRDDFDNFVNRINDYKDSSDLIIFGALTDIFNAYENKCNTPDALRKWIALKISELVELLNGNPPTSYYTEETLQILFEKSFFREDHVVSMVY